jgi:hypothetical protein
VPRANSGDRGTLRFYAYTRLHERRFLPGAQSVRFWPVAGRPDRSPTDPKRPLGPGPLGGAATSKTYRAAGLVAMM